MADALAGYRPEGAHEDRHSVGALLGWKAAPGGQQLQLVLQTAHSSDARRAGEIDSLHLMMTRQQAVQLANYLYSVTGETAPPARRGPLARLLG